MSSPGREEQQFNLVKTMFFLAMKLFVFLHHLLDIYHPQLENIQVNIMTHTKISSSIFIVYFLFTHKKVVYLNLILHNSSKIRTFMFTHNNTQTFFFFNFNNKQNNLHISVLVSTYFIPRKAYPLWWCNKELFKHLRLWVI